MVQRACSGLLPQRGKCIQGEEANSLPKVPNPMGTMRPGPGPRGPEGSKMKGGRMHPRVCETLSGGVQGIRTSIYFISSLLYTFWYVYYNIKFYHVESDLTEIKKEENIQNTMA